MKKKVIFVLSLVISLASCQKERSQVSEKPTDPVISNPAAKAAVGTSAKSGVCSTIQSFSAREGKKVGITFVHTIEVSYSIKPCDATQNLSATVEIYNYNTGELEFAYPGLPLSGKVLYSGASIGLHRVVLSSVDANTGAVIESQQTVIAVTSQGA